MGLASPALIRVALTGLAALAVAGCLKPESRVCAWGTTCPPGTLCHEPSLGCVVPAQLTVCVGLPDGEGCNPGGLTAPHLCRGEVCLPSECGDGLVDTRTASGEVCDDGNTEAGDGCRADCRGVESCGDGLVDEAAGEACDDGNGSDEDGCTHICQPPSCGDGLRTGGEFCDDGPQNSDTAADACRTDCRLPGCGDDVLDSNERGRCWTLVAAGRQPTGALAVDLATGDLDGDGLADLVVASRDASQLSVFLSDGAGGLVALPGSPYDVGHPPTAVTLADLDGDAALDVAAVCDDGWVAWWQGDGAGGLTLGDASPLPARFTAVAAADLRPEAGLELLATDRLGGLLWVLGLSPSGALEQVDRLGVGPAGAEPVAVVNADFDGDGQPEVAVANRAFAQIALLSLDATGDLQLAPDSPTAVGEHWSSTVGDLAVVDANGDGHEDLVWLDVRNWSSSFVGVWLGDGAGHFADDPGGLIEVGTGVLRLAAGDVDADGRMDLVAPRSTAAELYLLLGEAGATFLPAADGPAAVNAQSRAAALADFDGDGLLDLVLADQYADYVDLYLYAP